MQHFFVTELQSHTTIDIDSNYICISRYMEKDKTIEAFSALAQPTRMDAFKLIVMHEPDGIAAGEVSRVLDVPQNTMSTHLAIMTRAGLICIGTTEPLDHLPGQFREPPRSHQFPLERLLRGPSRHLRAVACRHRPMLPAQGEVQCMIASTMFSFSALETLHDRSWQNRF